MRWVIGLLSACLGLGMMAWLARAGVMSMAPGARAPLGAASAPPRTQPMTQQVGEQISDALARGAARASDAP